MTKPVIIPPHPSDLPTRLMLEGAPNGGWVLRAAPSHPSMEATLIGAFSTADDMLAGLRIALTDGDHV